MAEELTRDNQENVVQVDETSLKTKVLADVRAGMPIRVAERKYGASAVSEARADEVAFRRAVFAGVRVRQTTRRKAAMKGGGLMGRKKVVDKGLFTEEIAEEDEADSVEDGPADDVEPVAKPKARTVDKAKSDPIANVARRRVPKSEAVTSKDKASSADPVKSMLGGRIVLYVGGAILAVVAAFLVKQYTRRRRAEEARNRERVARMMEGRQAPSSPTARSGHATPPPDGLAPTDKISRLADEYQYRRPDGGQLGGSLPS